MIIRDGEPWFVAADVCRILDIDTSLAVNGRERVDRDGNTYRSGGLDEDEKGTDIVSTPKGPQEVLVVSEPGLYSLILKSRKPEARAFKRWITHEVIPSIRRTGSYSLPSTPMTVEDLIILQAQSVKELKAKVAELEEKTRVAMARIDIFDNVNIIGDPKQRLNAMIRKYAARNGLTYQQGWRDFRTAYNTAFRTNIVLVIEHYKAKHGLKALTMPEYLERVGKIEDALRVADKMLNPPISKEVAR